MTHDGHTPCSENANGAVYDGGSPTNYSRPSHMHSLEGPTPYGGDGSALLVLWLIGGIIYCYYNGIGGCVDYLRLSLGIIIGIVMFVFQIFSGVVVFVAKMLSDYYGG